MDGRRVLTRGEKMSKRPNARQKRGRALLTYQQELAMSQRVEASIMLHDPADQVGDERPRCDATGSADRFGDVLAQCYLTDGHAGEHRAWTTVSGDFSFSVPHVNSNPATPS